MRLNSEIISQYKVPENKLNLGFTQKSILQAKDLERNGINDQAVKRVYEEGISIDSFGAKTLDDGIFIERTKKGYMVKVSVCDVSSGISLTSPLGLEAFSKVQSIYLKPKVFTMLPENITWNVFSLNPGEIKPALTVCMFLDFNGHIYDSMVYESKFKNIQKYNYNNYSQVLQNPDLPNHELLNLINEVAKLRYSHRKGIKVGDINILKPGEFEVEQFMGMASYCVNSLLIKNKIENIIGYHQGKYFLKNHDTNQANSNFSTITSPARKFIDYLNGQFIVSNLIRKEQSPIDSNDLKEVLDYINGKVAFIANIDIKDIFLYGKDVKLDKKQEEKKKKNHSFKNPHNKFKKSNLQKLPKNVSNNNEFALTLELKNEIGDLFLNQKSQKDILKFLPQVLFSKDKKIITLFNDYIFKFGVVNISEVFTILNKTLNIGKVNFIQSPFLISQQNLQDESIITFSLSGEKIFELSTKTTVKKEFFTNQKSKALNGLRVQALKKIFEYFMK